MQPIHSLHAATASLLLATVLCILVSPVSAQIAVDVRTDRETYATSDTIRIAITATNTTDESITLQFNDGEQAAFEVNGRRGSFTCSYTAEPTERTLGAGESYTWGGPEDPSRPAPDELGCFDYAPSSQFGPSIEPGTYVLEGFVLKAGTGEKRYGTAQTTIMITPSGSASAQLSIEPDTVFFLRDRGSEELQLVNQGRTVQIDSMRIAGFDRSDVTGSYQGHYRVYADSSDEPTEHGFFGCMGYDVGCENEGFPLEHPQGASALLTISYDGCPACKRAGGVPRDPDSLLIYVSGAKDTVRTVVIDFSRLVSVEEPADEKVTLELSVYPHPARKKATVRLHASQPTRLGGVVVDVLGRVVLSIPSEHFATGTQEIELHRRDFPAAGPYYIRWTAEEDASAIHVHTTPLTWK